MSPKVKNILAWILTAIMTFQLGMAGFFKVIAHEDWVNNFSRWDYPLWFMYVIGVLQLAAVVGLYIPKTRIWAAMGIIGLMIGAFATHMMNGETTSIGGSIGLIVMSAAFIWLRKK